MERAETKRLYRGEWRTFMLWQILVQFLFRLAFGLASAMAFTSTRDVTPGFFRVHLWVAMGLTTFLAAAVWLIPEFPDRSTVLALAIGATVTSYVGAIVWLYERRRLGWWLLMAVAGWNLLGILHGLNGPTDTAAAWTSIAWGALDRISAGWLLGLTFAAMLLGHWYLNTPTMKLAPLQRLIVAMAIIGVMRIGFSATGLWSSWTQVSANDGPNSLFLAFLALRWLAGLIGLLALALMTWWTLKIPNTQSATGILYVAVIFAFLGELTSQFLSSQTLYPV